MPSSSLPSRSTWLLPSWCCLILVRANQSRDVTGIRSCIGWACVGGSGSEIRIWPCKGCWFVRDNQSSSSHARVPSRPGLVVERAAFIVSCISVCLTVSCWKPVKGYLLLLNTTVETWPVAEEGVWSGAPLEKCHSRPPVLHLRSISHEYQGQTTAWLYLA